ncbi:kinase-like domain-containing protein [Diplogelasinospora grovesii]|uniref:non-specific serine/threonine protein kinase n=1 Tax=Diplogelasinospora grovesii TaxID=303347 RepID=A0AAN6S0L8_9PEZI|nr:kinase-like domain-containing protein [Diplogelasinospora grovesii]
MSTDSSPPSSPGSFLPNKRMDTNRLRLKLAPFRLEKIIDYEPGGLHPVHLGDLFGDGGRYRVIHKLGNGGFATVWLCRDTEAGETTKYVALKILMADASTADCPDLRVNDVKAWHSASQDSDDGAESICLPLDQFVIHGPNGDHLCFVYPVLGPKVSHGSFRASPDVDKISRTACLRTVMAVAFLHSHGICHGDITASNILHRVSGLDGLDEDEVLRVLGLPEQNPVHKGTAEGHDEPGAPKYLVYPVKWLNVDLQYISQQPCVIDFGESFEVSRRPEGLGTPGSYRAPELMLDGAAGLGSDLWALGCTLFEIRTGRKLFSAFMDEDDEYLLDMIEILGKMPEPWWSTTWKERKEFFEDEADEHGRAVSLHPERKTSEGKRDGYTVSVHPSVAEGAQSLKDKLAPGVWYLDIDFPDDNDHRDISQMEIDVFADLLGQFLKWDPHQRISAKAALDHEWFRL